MLMLANWRYWVEMSTWGLGKDAFYSILHENFACTAFIRRAAEES